MTGRTSFFFEAIVTYQLSIILFDDLGNDARTDGETAFTDGELRTLLKRHRHDQLHRQVHIVTRHDHLHAFRQGDVTSHIHRADVELRPIAT